MNKKILFRGISSLVMVTLWPGVSLAGYQSGNAGARLDSPFSFNQADRSAMREFGEVSDGVRSVGVAETASVAGDEPKDPGDARFHTYFSHDTIYDSNIFSRSNDPEGDLIEVPTVAVGLTRGREGVSRHYAELFYDVSYLDHAEYDKLDRLTHNIHAGYQWRGEKLKMSIANDLSPLSPQGTRDRREFSGAVDTSTVIATSNNLKFKSAYQVSPKWILSADWGHEIHDYPEASHGNSEAVARLSRQTHTLRPGLSYQITAKSSVYMGYEIATADYFRGGDFAFKSHAARAGFVTRLDPKTVFLFESGYKVRDFNQPRFDGGDLFVYKTSLRRQLGKKFDWTVMGTRDLALNLDYGSQSTTHYGMGIDRTSIINQLKWELSPSMSLVGDAAVGFERVETPYSLIDPETGALQTGEREDVTYSWGIAWQWERSSFDQYRIGYRYFDRSSEFNSFEYQNHELTASVILGFK